jgi:hypothetical protein
MNVKKFDKLERRDFDNGAILEDIRGALRDKEDLEEAFKDLTNDLEGIITEARHRLL